MRTREHTSSDFGQRILGAVDLAIDLATLGEYGLEHLPGDMGSPADGRCRERRGHPTAWEAFATARRGGCAAPVTRPATHAGRVRAASSRV
jgi:hypothetical protein